MHDRPLIRGLRGDGESIRGIARGVGASRNAVRRALAPDARDSYWRASESEAAEPAVRAVLAVFPAMVVSDIAVLVDWRLSRRQLSDLVARLRPEYREMASDVDARPLESLSAREIDAPDVVFGLLNVEEVSW